MADKLSKERRSENMRKIRSKHMKPELAIRKLVHILGYRYRLHGSNLPGKPDLVFSNRKKVIFVNGCFWHQHMAIGCNISRIPKSNLDFWLPKLERTKQRDKEHLKNLKKAGWDALVIWECQIKNQNAIKKKIVNFLD